MMGICIPFTGMERSLKLPSHLRIFLTSPYDVTYPYKYTDCYDLAAFRRGLRVINVYLRFVTGCYDVFTTNIYDLFRVITDKYEHATTLQELFTNIYEYITDRYN